MSTQNEPVPIEAEIRQQLQRMLESEFFSSRKKPAAILRFLVEEALKGIKGRTVGDKDIADSLYAIYGYPSGPGAARVNASYMRVLVAKYNSQDHPEDNVVIEFPKSSKGPKSSNYEPSFRYNQNRKQYRTYKESLAAMRQVFPHGISTAIKHLQFLLQITNHRPSDAPPHGNIPAMMALAECRLIKYMIDSDPVHLLHLRQITNHAVNESPDHWRTHTMLALLALANRQIGHAATHFEDAIRLNAAEISKYRWYHAFLFAVGREDAAFDLAQAEIRNNPSDPVAYAILGLWCLHINSDQAGYCVLYAQQLDPGCTIAILAHTIWCISDGGIATHALPDIETLENVINYARALYPGLIRRIAERTAGVEGQRIWHDYLERHKNQFNEENTPFLPFQNAIAAITNEERHPEAIEHLELAFSNGNPLVMWLHMMPFFKPLYKYDRFQSLLSRRLEPPPAKEPPIHLTPFNFRD
jgi:tetratricopeptide (TPR) repeat protein